MIERGTVPLPFRHVLDWDHKYAPVVILEDLWAGAHAEGAGYSDPVSGFTVPETDSEAWAQVALKIEDKLSNIDKESYSRMYINLRAAWRLVVNVVSRGHVNHWRDEVHASYKYVVARNERYMAALEGRYR